MRKIEIYNSTALVEALLTYKGVAIEIHPEPCPAFQDATDPIIFDNGRWIIGVNPILGYLDRRILWPQFFPDDHDEFAKASMVFDHFQKEAPDPSEWLQFVGNNAFVLGKEPCVIDLILSRIEFDNPVWRAYQTKVNAVYGFNGVAA